MHVLLGIVCDIIWMIGPPTALQPDLDVVCSQPILIAHSPRSGVDSQSMLSSYLDECLLQFAGAVLLGAGVTSTIKSGVADLGQFEDAPSESTFHRKKKSSKHLMHSCMLNLHTKPRVPPCVFLAWTSTCTYAECSLPPILVLPFVGWSCFHLHSCFCNHHSFQKTDKPCVFLVQHSCCMDLCVFPSPRQSGTTWRLSWASLYL